MVVMMVDDKKRKRMISNRESARRSRMKRQKHMEDLINEKDELERKIKEDNRKCNAILQRLTVLESENKILRAEKEKLTHYLNNMHQILHQSYKQKSETGHSDNNNQVSETLLFSWQVHGNLQPITASGRLKSS